MTTLTYIEASGSRTDVDVPDGWSLMQAAIANGIDGILGECGGSCACATCHCYVDDLLMPRALGGLFLLVPEMPLFMRAAILVLTPIALVRGGLWFLHRASRMANALARHAERWGR